MGMMALGVLAGTLVAALFAMLMPKVYESSAVIEISHPDWFRKEFPHLGDSRFRNSGSEMFRTRKPMTYAADSLGLEKKWGVGSDKARSVLADKVRTAKIGGSDLIRISARDRDREFAREIAEAMLEASKRHTEEIGNEAVAEMITSMRKAVREMEDRVEERRKVLTTFIHAAFKNAPWWDESLLDLGWLEGGSEIRLPKASVNGTGNADKVNLIRERPEQTDNFGFTKQDYVDAKRDYLIDLGLLKDMKRELMICQTSGSNSVYRVVVHEEPVTPDDPELPDLKLCLLIGAGVGALLSPFLVQLIEQPVRVANPAPPCPCTGREASP